MLLGLRLLEGVKAKEFQERHGKDYRLLFASEIAELSRKGLLSFDGETVRLTREGEDFCNVVFREFV